MIKGKSRTVTTVTLMTIFAVVIIATYLYWINRTKPLNDSGDNLSKVQKMLDKNLDLYYPKTPAEVTKLFAGMMKTIYNNPDDKDIKALALKTRKLYDQEFLKNNPEDTYIKNIVSDLSIWKKAKRKITNYVLVSKEKDRESEIDGVKYAANHVKFTIQENAKYTQTWNVLLRQDSSKQWKILGWKIVSDKDNNN